MGPVHVQSYGPLWRSREGLIDPGLPTQCLPSTPRNIRLVTGGIHSYHGYAFRPAA